MDTILQAEPKSFINVETDRFMKDSKFTDCTLKKMDRI
jgi:hypothetical protein